MKNFLYFVIFVVLFIEFYDSFPFSPITRTFPHSVIEALDGTRNWVNMETAPFINGVKGEAHQFIADVRNTITNFSNSIGGGMAMGGHH